MRIISLFCGPGGMDLGFIKAGHKIVWANDNDEDCIKTYKKNIAKKYGHEDRVVFDDIENIDTKEIPKGGIVIGGFPCQGFSIANPYRHIKDKRNDLFSELLKVIKAKKPKYFVAENVPGILSIGEGKVIDMIMNDFKRAGYKAKYKIINAADFGVPQIRKRVIFLGTRKDVKKEISYPEPTHAENPSNKRIKKWLTVRDAISGLPEPSSLCKIPNHQGTQHKVKINGFIGNRKTKWNKPSPTIVGRGGGTGGPVIIPHPNLKRRLTVRECAKLQSFLNSFVFCGSISSQYRQIGNAVPWPLAYRIAKMIPC